MLQAAGAQYRIIDEDGQEYKNFEEKKSRNYKYPFGALTNYIRPYVEKMEVGEDSCSQAREAIADDRSKSF